MSCSSIFIWNHNTLPFNTRDEWVGFPQDIHVVTGCESAWIPGLKLCEDHPCDHIASRFSMRYQHVTDTWMHRQKTYNISPANRTFCSCVTCFSICWTVLVFNATNLGKCAFTCSRFATRVCPSDWQHKYFQTATINLFVYFCLQDSLAAGILALIVHSWSFWKWCTDKFSFITVNIAECSVAYLFVNIAAAITHGELARLSFLGAWLHREMDCVHDMHSSCQ